MKKKRILAAVLATLMVSTMTLSGTAFAAQDSAMGLSAEETAPQTRGIIANTKTNFTMQVGESVQATLDTPVRSGTWTSSNPAVATVDQNGKITGKQMGQAIISVTSVTGETIRCTASVGFHVGIDISTHNNYSGKPGESRKPVDWVKVKEQGVDFAIIRSSYGWENYPNQVDATFAGNVKGAYETGIPFGLYHYSYAETVEDARKEADYLLKAIEDFIPEYADKITLPIAYDMEETHMQKLSKEELTNIALAFCERIEQAGYRPMIYSVTVLFKRMDLEAFRERGYPIWYAYPDNESANFSVRKPVGQTGFLSDVWQYTFRSKMEGTGTQAGNTDVNVAYMSNCTISSLSTPVLSSALQNNGKVTLKWNAVSNADRYNIYRYSSNGKEKVIGSTDQLTFTDTTAQAGQTYTYSVMAVHNCDDIMNRVTSAQSAKSTSITISGTAGNPVVLDTRSVQMTSNVSSYRFLVKGNNDAANIKVESSNPNVAAVTLENASDSRGAKYRVDAKAAGDAEIKVTYQGQTASMTVKVYPVGGSIMLDTSNYVMAPGNQYTIGAFVRDAQGNKLSGAQTQELVKNGKLVVRDSRTGSIVDLKQLSTGNFQVTAKNEGTCYIMYEINGVHASVRIDVKKGLAKPYGSAIRSITYWANKG